MHVVSQGGAPEEPGPARASDATARAGYGKPVAARHIPALDGLRGVAVLTVVFYHFGGGATSDNLLVRSVGLFLKVGWSGVTLFFLLSGFLITGILWDSKGEAHWWRNFYVRRMLRIFPLYYGTLLLIALIALLSRDWDGFQYLLVPLCFLQNVTPLYKLVERIPGNLALYHYWSLAVEEQFYLLWPLLLMWMRTRRQAAAMCMTVFVLSCLFRVWVQTTSWAPGWELLPSRAGELALGGWIAFAYRSRWWEKLRPWMMPVVLLSAAGVSLIARQNHGFALYARPTMLYGLVVITLGYAALLGLALSGGLFARMMSAGWLRWIGKISYGIYVFHVLFIHQYNQIAKALVSPDHRTAYLLTRLAVVTAGSIGLAWLSYRFYESPFLRLKKRFEARRTSVAHTAEPVATTA